MDYLTSITDDHKELIQALKDTAAGRPCIVVLTALTTRSCGKTTLLDGVVKTIFNCHLLNPHIGRWEIQLKFIQVRNPQCLFLPALEHKGRTDDLDHTIANTVTNLLRYQINKPIWIDSILPPQDFGQTLTPYKVYTIRLKPITKVNRNFSEETFTQRFYWRLNRELFGGGLAKWSHGFWPSGSEAESQTLLQIPRVKDDWDSEYSDGHESQHCYDYSAISTIPSDWDQSYLKLYQTHQGSQRSADPKTPDVTMAISQAAIEKTSSDGRTGAYLRAMLIHDQVTKLAQLCNAPVPLDEFSDLLQLRSFKFTIEYTTVDSREDDEVTTTIQHDFKSQLADESQAETAKIGIILS